LLHLILRKVNEDKLSIHINKKLQDKDVSYMAIFDGHNGESLANELKETFHNRLFEDGELLTNTELTLIKQTQDFDNEFINVYRTTKALDDSGSCLLMSLLFDNKIYIANLGDSRAIISSKGDLSLLSLEHNITLKREKDRILRLGGSIYFEANTLKVNPGGIIKTRTLGDIKYKLGQFISKEGLVISTPDVLCIEQNGNFDFIILGSDGLYEKLTNIRIATIVYESCLNFEESFEKLLDSIIRNITKEAIDAGTRDNITFMFLCFENLYVNYINKRKVYFENIIEKYKNTHDDEVLLYNNILSKTFL
jgi:protein phosphatase 2C family protein 2/3